jgi:hypothetical protein
MSYQTASYQTSYPEVMFGHLELTPLWGKNNLGNFGSKGSLSATLLHGAKLFYGTATLDQSLATHTDELLRLDKVPPQVVVKYWADAQGRFFFYFQSGMDNEVPHYVPNTTRQLMINGAAPIDLDQKRMRVAVMLMQSALQKALRLHSSVALPDYLSQHGFGNLSDADERMACFPYFGLLTKLAWENLDALTTLLEDAAEYSQNPNMKTWLADLYIALAAKPVVESIERGFAADWSNKETRLHLARATQLTESAQADCLSAFLQIGQFSPTDAYLPFEPFDINSFGKGGWKFYAGVYDQARLRHRAIAKLKNTILASGSLNHIVKLLKVA